MQIIYNFRPTMRSLSSFFILCFVLPINGESYDEKVWSQNQTFSLYAYRRPFVVNAEIRFMVEVTNSSKSNTTSYEYRFKFDQFPQLDKTIVSTWPTGFHAVKFASTCELKGGNYTVQVDVWKFQLGFPTHSIGTILYTLEVTDCNWIGQSNDGPATLGTQITFIAYNWYRMDYGPPFEYRFKFEQFPEHDKSIVSTKGEVEYIITFESSSTLKPGNYNVQVDVWDLGVPSYSLGTANSTFQLTDSLIGFIKLDQEFHFCTGIESSSENTVFNKKPTKLIADIRDPSGYFTGRCGIHPFNITYKWTVNGEVQEESSKVIEHTFSQLQLNNVSVIVTATKTNGSRLIQKSGTFNLTLESKAADTNGWHFPDCD